MRSRKKPAVAMIALLMIIVSVAIITIASIQVVTGKHVKYSIGRESQTITHISGRSVCYDDNGTTKQIIVYYDNRGVVTKTITQNGCSKHDGMSGVKKFNVTLIGAGGGGTFPRFSYDKKELAKDSLNFFTEYAQIPGKFFNSGAGVYQQYFGDEIDINQQFATNVLNKCYLVLATSNGTCPRTTNSAFENLFHLTPLSDNKDREVTYKIITESGIEKRILKIKKIDSSVSCPDSARTADRNSCIILKANLTGDNANHYEVGSTSGNLDSGDMFPTKTSNPSSMIKLACKNSSNELVYMDVDHKIDILLNYWFGKVSSMSSGNPGQVVSATSVNFPTDVKIGKGGAGGQACSSNINNCSGKDGGDTSATLDKVKYTATGGTGASTNDTTNDIILYGSTSENSITDSHTYNSTISKNPDFALNQDIASQIPTVLSNGTFGTGGISGYITTQSLDSMYATPYFIVGGDKIKTHATSPSVNSNTVIKTADNNASKGVSGALVLEW